MEPSVASCLESRITSNSWLTEWLVESACLPQPLSPASVVAFADDAHLPATLVFLFWDRNRRVRATLWRFSSRSRVREDRCRQIGRELSHNARGGRLDDLHVLAILSCSARKHEVGVKRHPRTAVRRLESEHKSPLRSTSAGRIRALGLEARRMIDRVEIFQLHGAREA